MAYNNAVVTYAQRAGSQVKGRVVSDISGDGTNAESEFEHFYAAYEREVEKEIKGELEPSFSVIRDNGMVHLKCKAILLQAKVPLLKPVSALTRMQ